MTKQKVPTRTRLIKSAVMMFQTHGYYGTSTQDIIDAAKAPRGSLYHHFPGGKTELAAACIEAVTTDLIERIRTLRLEGLSPVQVVENIAAGIAQWLRKTKWKEGLLLPVLTHEFAGKDALMHKMLTTAYKSIITELSQMLAVAGAPTDRQEKNARLIIACLEGASGMARTLKSSAPLIDDMDWSLIEISKANHRK